MIVETFITNTFEGDVIEQFIVYDDGTCVLQWMFDGVGEDESSIRKILLVHLTEEEAKKVFQRNSIEEGILEPVRNNMTYPEARIMFIKRSTPYTFSQTDYMIPSEGDEEQFLDSLDSIQPGF